MSNNCYICRSGVFLEFLYVPGRVMDPVLLEFIWVRDETDLNKGDDHQVIQEISPHSGARLLKSLCNKAELYSTFDISFKSGNNIFAADFKMYRITENNKL